MLGEDTLASVLDDDSIPEGLEFDRTTMNNRDYCLSDVYSGASETTEASTDVLANPVENATSQLQDDEALIVTLENREFATYIDESQSNSQNVKGIILSAKLLANESNVMVLLEDDGEMRVWRTAKGEEANLVSLTF